MSIWYSFSLLLQELMIGMMHMIPSICSDALYVTAKSKQKVDTGGYRQNQQVTVRLPAALPSRYSC